MEKKTSALCCAVRCVVFESLAGESGEARDAPLAQLAEQVTLNYADCEAFGAALHFRLLCFRPASISAPRGQSPDYLAIRVFAGGEGASVG